MVYSRILVTLDNSPSDRVILDHIKPLARLASSEIVLVHVADGFVARHQEVLDLHDSEEITADRRYLEKQEELLRAEGLQARACLVCGEPPTEILKVAENEKCDLIAMATHGHGPLADLVLGSVAETVRHKTNIPLLLVRDPNRR